MSGYEQMIKMIQQNQRYLHFIPRVLLPFQNLVPTLPTVQPSRWVASLEAIYSLPLLIQLQILTQPVCAGIQSSSRADGLLWKSCQRRPPCDASAFFWEPFSREETILCDTITPPTHVRDKCLRIIYDYRAAQLLKGLSKEMPGPTNLVLHM